MKNKDKMEETSIVSLRAKKTGEINAQVDEIIAILSAIRNSKFPEERKVMIRYAHSRLGAAIKLL